MNKLIFESTAKVRDDFAKHINRVEFGHDTIILTRRGRPLVKMTRLTDDDHARIKAEYPEMYK